jgi:hypothetical protein
MVKKMMKHKHQYLLFFVLQFGRFPLFAAEPGKEQKHFFIAAGETLLVNALFIGVTGFIFNFPWARPTTETISNNFSRLPIWEDTDGFKVNQIGHPYQGSLYFIAGRANGFTFYESILFNALGSVTWETVCESTAPSINDMITTTLASAPVDEMLHRLYLEADAAGIPTPLSFLISPMDGLNRLITGRKPPKECGNIHMNCHFPPRPVMRKQILLSNLLAGICSHFVVRQVTSV